MKSIISIPLNDKAKITVEEGQDVDNKTVIFETAGSLEERIIPIGDILKVSPNKIGKLLKKQPNQDVIQGEIIAEKKSFVSQISVRSPIDGTIKELDLKKGFLIITPKSQKENKKVTIPVKGKIKKVGKSAIDIEVKGISYPGVRGDGKNVLGKIYKLSKSRTGMIDFDDEVEEKIVLIPELNSASAAKLDVLGSLGAIVKKSQSPLDFSFLEVSAETYDSLHQNEGSTVWLRPKEKEIIVLDE